MSTEEKTVGATEDGNVNVRLAHPLREIDRVPLGIDADVPIQTGDVVTVSLNSAINMIGAGLVQVDPEDHAAVTALLTPAVKPDEVVPSSDGVADPGPGDPQVVVLGADTIAGLKGAALDEALTDRDLSTSGTVDEKRARLSGHVPAPVEPPTE